LAKEEPGISAVKAFMDKEDHAMMAAFQELKDAIKIKRVNDELLEYLVSSLQWLVRYSKKNHIPLPDIDKIEETIDRAINTAERLRP
jgi:2-phosphoglycerate kinase